MELFFGQCWQKFSEKGKTSKLKFRLKWKNRFARFSSNPLYVDLYIKSSICIILKSHMNRMIYSIGYGTKSTQMVLQIIT